MGRLLREAEVSVTVPVPPEAVWAVVVDVTRTGEWSHEARRVAWAGGATAAVPGARFRGRNQMGPVVWWRACEVVRADPPHELVWRTVPSRLLPDSTVWRITLQPEGDGTRITQRFDVVQLSPAFDRLLWRVAPPHRDRRAALAEDLRRLGEVAARTGGAPPG